jgi:hypothetical protein
MIVYAVICRAKDAAILVEVSSPELGGNAPQVTTALLEHLRDHPDQLAEGERKTFLQRNEELDLFSMFLESCSAYGLSTTTETTTNNNNNAEEHYFHLYKTAGVIYCCLGDDNDLRTQKVYVILSFSLFFLDCHGNGDDDDDVNVLKLSFSPTATFYFSITHMVNSPNSILPIALPKPMPTRWIKPFPKNYEVPCIIITFITKSWDRIKKCKRYWRKCKI